MLNASVFRAMDEEREDQYERAQHLRHCMPVSTPDQTPGPSLFIQFCCVSIFFVPSILSFSHNVIYCARHMSAHSAYIYMFSSESR